MAWASWVLNWGFLKFTDAYDVTGQTERMCDMVKWPLKYFLRAWVPSKETLYVQVGLANVIVIIMLHVQTYCVAPEFYVARLNEQDRIVFGLSVSDCVLVFESIG